MSFTVRGYIEGYYGKAHTHAQRLELCAYLKKVHMNAYMYAPKDDNLHRAEWRKPYPATKIKEFKDLIRVANKNKVRFIYAMSPGLTFNFSNKKDYRLLVKKFQQLQQVGDCDFALLLDDIPADLSPEDKKVFKNQGAAHAWLVNKLHADLGSSRLYFCPTVYCSVFIPSHDEAYLEEVSAINTDVPFFWTGPEVVSEKITAGDVKQIVRTVKRKLIIWDNFHANDYAPQKIYLGPLTGRTQSLQPYCEGYMTNMSECFNLNLIPLATVADYALNPKEYKPEVSIKKAIRLHERKNPQVLEYIRSFLNTPFTYGPKAKKTIEKIKNATLTAHEADTIKTALWALERTEENARILDELYVFLYPILIDLRHYKELKELTPHTKEKVRRSYKKRTTELNLAVTKMADKALNKL